MTRSLRRLAVVLALLMTALLVNVTYLQFFASADLRNRPANSRVLLDEYSRERGPILLGSTAIAASIRTADQLRYLRQYANGPLYESATGYYSVVYGATGIERAENSVLAGSDDRFFVDRLQHLFAGRGVKGGAVRLTLDPAAQKAAFDGLAGRTGAVVAIDPRTGAILALVSSPSFDPNALSSHNPAKIRDTYAALLKDPAEPMLNRPLAMTLPPGSTFKLVTAAAALESGNYTPTTMVPGPASLKLPNTTKVLHNWSGTACGPKNTTTLENALAISCNTAFASIGLALGDQALRSQAEKFGFGTSFDIPLHAATSRFPAQLNEPQTAMAAIGQYDVTATALQMAMVAAAIGNNGQVMNPYLVAQVLSPELQTLETAAPSAFSQAMSPANASTLMAMMVTVVERGTGSNARIPGITVGGKTGTAQTAPGRPPHAWFVAVAPAGIGGLAQIAVAVVLENGGGAAEVSGNKLAAPIARAVIEAVLRR